MHVFFAVHYLQFFYWFDLLVVLSTDTALKPIFLHQICAVCFRILYSLFLDVIHFADSLLYALESNTTNMISGSLLFPDL